MKAKHIVEPEKDVYEEDQSNEMFYDKGRFKRTFTHPTLMSNKREAVYKALHRFEGKWYVIKKIAMSLDPSGATKRPKFFKRVSQLADLTHPNLLSYITCWAEERDARQKTVAGLVRTS